MIELAGTRYAVGRGPAIGMIALSVCACTAYGLVVTAMTTRLIVGHPISWNTPRVAFAFYFAFSIVAGYTICLVLMNADKQSVIPLPEGQIRTRSQSELLSLVRSRPIVVAVIIYASLAVGRYLIVPLNDRLSYAVLVLILCSSMGWHVWILSRLSIRMWREANRRVNGRLDKKRDWDWDRYTSSDTESFGRQFGFKKKYPGDIRHPAEADDLAQKSRDKRIMLMTTIVPVTIIAVAALVTQPLITELSEIISLNDGATEQSTISILWRGLRFNGLLFATCIPFYLQHKAALHAELARVYDERAKELRAQRARRQPVQKRRHSIRQQPYLNPAAGRRMLQIHTQNRAQSTRLREPI